MCPVLPNALPVNIGFAFYHESLDIAKAESQLKVHFNGSTNTLNKFILFTLAPVSSAVQK